MNHLNQAPCNFQGLVGYCCELQEVLPQVWIGACINPGQQSYQGIVGCTPTTVPLIGPMGNPYVSPI